MIERVKAAILAVGTELLGSDRLDTNSLRLTVLLERHGVELMAKAVVGDEEAAIARTLERLVADADLVLVTGGLGPTRDDVTREAVASLTGRALAVNGELLAWIEERFRRLGRPMPALNSKQAELLDGATVWENRHGIAPAQLIGHGNASIVLFPGVPRELDGFLAGDFAAWLAAHTGDAQLEQVELRVACLPESVVEERIQPAYGEFGRAAISVLASPGEVRVRARSTEIAAARQHQLERMRRRLTELIGDAVFSAGGDSLEAVVGELLVAAGDTVATAESCTGGLIAERLTRVAGASAYLQGAVVAYSNAAKRDLLGVSAAVLAGYGAVSEAVAAAMATGVRRRFASSWGLAVTGIAGPSGGSDDKPVGTVHLALSGPASGDLSHHLTRFLGDRERVRWQAAQLGLDLLRRRLLARSERRQEAS